MCNRPSPCFRAVWTENHDDSFLAPLRVQGDTLVQVRRRTRHLGRAGRGEPHGDTGLTKWTTHLAAPLAALVASESRQTVDALTTDGRLYSLGNDQFAAKLVQRPAFPRVTRAVPSHADASLSTDGQTLVWTESSAVGSVYFYELKTGGKAHIRFRCRRRHAAPAAAFGGGAIAPLTNGSVMFVSPNSAEPKVDSVLASARSRCLAPVDSACRLRRQRDVPDQRWPRHRLCRVETRSPAAAIGRKLARQKPSGPIHSPLVLAGSTAIGIMRQERSDAIAGFDSRAAAAFEPVPLEGRVTAGPFAVGGLVFVAAEPDGLVCFSGDGKIRWQQATSLHGPIAGPPLATTRGRFARCFSIRHRLPARRGDRQGAFQARHRRTAARSVVPSGANVYLSGSDGVVHRIPDSARGRKIVRHGKSA